MYLQFFQLGRKWKSNSSSLHTERIPWSLIIKSLNPIIYDEMTDDAYDFLDKLLLLNCETRMDAMSSLNHPFIRDIKLRDPFDD